MPHISFHRLAARREAEARLDHPLVWRCTYGSHAQAGCAEVTDQEWAKLVEVRGIAREQCPYHRADP